MGCTASTQARGSQLGLQNGAAPVHKAVDVHSKDSKHASPHKSPVKELKPAIKKVKKSTSKSIHSNRKGSHSSSSSDDIDVTAAPYHQHLPATAGHLPNEDDVDAVTSLDAAASSNTDLHLEKRQHPLEDGKATVGAVPSVAEYSPSALGEESCAVDAGASLESPSHGCVDWSARKAIDGDVYAADASQPEAPLHSEAPCLDAQITAVESAPDLSATAGESATDTCATAEETTPDTSFPVVESTPDTLLTASDAYTTSMESPTCDSTTAPEVPLAVPVSDEAQVNDDAAQANADVSPDPVVENKEDLADSSVGEAPPASSMETMFSIHGDSSAREVAISDDAPVPQTSGQGFAEDVAPSAPPAEAYYSESAVSVEQEVASSVDQAADACHDVQVNSDEPPDSLAAADDPPAEDTAASSDPEPPADS